MQSSVGLAFRAFVMLACLALVPLLAIYGKQLPDFYRAVVDAYKARTQQKAADPLAGLGRDVPSWAPTNAHPSGDASWRGPGSALNTQPSSPAPASPAPAPWNNAIAPLQPLTNPNQSATAPPGSVRPASFAAPLDAGKSADAIATTSHEQSSNSESQTGATPDKCTVQFRQVEQRLRELGATYYFLETWGAAGDRYRFYCKVALVGNTDSGHNRVFQATDADPLQAMESVLDQVELWRSGRE